MSKKELVNKERKVLMDEYKVLIIPVFKKFMGDFQKRVCEACGNEKCLMVDRISDGVSFFYTIISLAILEQCGESMNEFLLVSTLDDALDEVKATILDIVRENVEEHFKTVNKKSPDEFYV